jgi:hypothetical protein
MVNPLCLAQTDTLPQARVFYQLQRLQLLDQWWHWGVLLLVLATLLGYVWWWYRRDTVELSSGWKWSLLLLRLTTYAGLILFFLDLQRYSEQQQLRPSRLAMLIDTSLSMALPKTGSPSAADDAIPSRIESVIELLSEDALLPQLIDSHDVTVYRFDSQSRPTPVESFTLPRQPAEGPQQSADQLLGLWRACSWLAWSGSGLAVVSAIALLVGLLINIVLARGVSMTTSAAGSTAAYGALFGTVGLLISGVLVGTAVLRGSDLDWKSLWQWQAPSASQLIAGLPPAADATDRNVDSQPVGSPGSGSAGSPATSQAVSQPVSPAAAPWGEHLAPTGTQTRLGDSVQTILQQEPATSLAGIVLVTDGQNNAGIDPLRAAAQAAAAGVPLLPIGVGDTQSPQQLQLVEVEAPRRVFPGDPFKLSGLLQAIGLAGRDVSVSLRRWPTDRQEPEGGPRQGLDQQRSVRLEEDELLLSIPFEVQPPEVGNWTYELEVVAADIAGPAGRSRQTVEVQVVEPRSRLLIVAGGPTREYQFARNLFYRDQNIQSHVWLQTATEGVSQEAQELLTSFPETLADLSEYDCILAFDADWSKLTAAQMSNLERWVGEQAGGLILIAGSVHTPSWIGSRDSGQSYRRVLQGLAPVVLDSRGGRLVSMGRQESETPWPLAITEDGRRSQLFDISEDASRSEQLWSQFSGVYSYVACYDAKPGASVLATYSDPAARLAGEPPVYLASHFYGAGRVLFQAGGELWRLRELSEPAFDTYYVQQVRWASQGRLLRDSDRGLLLVDKPQALVGDQVLVRALLKDAQFQPLLEPQVDARVIDPTGRSRTLRLLPLPDNAQPGVYTGQLPAQRVGNYLIELPLGGLASQELLTANVRVRLPTLEIQRPQRNDSLLQELADRTGGEYFPSPDAAVAVGPDRLCQLAARIDSKQQVTFLPGAPDRTFQLKLHTLLMVLIGAALSLEWLIRRLCRLA